MLEDNIPKVVAEPQPTPVEQAPGTQPPEPEDLLTRVSKFTTDKDPEVKPEDNISDDFDLKEIENITDPVAKEQAMKAYKSFQRGFGKKFDELAQLRKEMQTYIEQSKGQEEWTPEKVQALANDPKFIQAAQQVAGTSESSDEYSALSEVEKKNLKAMQDEIQNLKRINTQALQTQQQQLRNSQHQEFTKKYANYDPDKIDQLTYEMLEGKVTVTPEHIYKAWYHDDNVRKAYELGRKDERDGVSEKIASASVEGIAASPSVSIEPEKDESSLSFFNRIIQKNLKLAKAKS